MKNKSNWILLGPFVAFVVFVLVYYGIYSRGTGEQDLASAADDPIVYDPVPPHLFVGSCTGCQLKYFPKDVVAFEDELVCTPERNYLAHQISQNPITLTADRKDYSEAQFPKSCVVFIQKTFWDAYREPARMFSYCASDRGEPQTGRLVPCVNREYVNVVYHSLVDVADCLNIPQKFLLPKLLNESGLHINTLGAGKDGGVGQMTKPAIQAVLNDIYSDRRGYSVLDHYRAEMRKSGKASCQRLLRHPEAFEKVIPDDTERCNLMGGGANPLRNLVYTGVFYRTMMELAAGIHYRAGKDVVIHRDGRVEEVSPDKNFT
ncbi:MAG: hypothetical protein N2578_10065, partial [Bdellovibrionaceae bacterium]|nr:hypothetical protein [Pseudobdellovibrionaceae bacterium]